VTSARSAREGDVERALIERIADGDERALEDLYRRFEPRVLGFARQRLNDPAAASDILNEVMLEIWKSAPRFEGRSSVATWVLSITRHRVIDRLRQRGNRVFEDLDEAGPADTAASAEDALAGAGDASAVRDCIERLPDAQREAVHLAFFEDLAYGEIARIMDCPEGTVKTRVYHAKRSLKDCLAAAEVAGA
jgi:RNA polymerase sigma-70 factor (ECF subfamily)